MATQTEPLRNKFRADLALSDLRGKRVLLVFSSPHCDPCDVLAPELEKFHMDRILY